MNEMNIFLRQIPVFGKECQKKIESSSVLVAGVGGLGSTVTELLVRLGIGELHIFDNGIVDEPDLNRQRLYTKDDIGKKKVFVAEENLLKITGKTKVKAYFKKIDKELKLPEKIDLAIDCLDNFTSRYILDELLEKRGIPLIHAGIESYFFQVTTIDRVKIKRLKDIFPDIKDKKKIPVIAPTAVIAASLEVIEALKFICNITDNLSSKILVGDLKDYDFTIVNLKRDN